MAARVRTTGEYPNQKTEIVGTLAEVLAIAGPIGAEGIAEDTQGRMVYKAAGWYGDAGVFADEASLLAAASTMASGSTARLVSGALYTKGA